MPRENRQLVPAKDLPFKKTVNKIINHSTDGKCGVRFRVEWKGTSAVSVERSPFIMSKKEGKAILSEYIMRINLNQPRRFEFMVQRQPDLADLLKLPTYRQFGAQVNPDETLETEDTQDTEDLQPPPAA